MKQNNKQREKSSFWKKIWAEALPFVARSPEMKIDWLVSEFNKDRLACHEMTPYMSLLLNEYENQQKDPDGFDEEKDGSLEELCRELSEELVGKMVKCTDVYDIPVLLKLVPTLTIPQAVVVLSKTVPPFEEKPLLVRDKVFQAMQANFPEVLKMAVKDMREKGIVSKEFEQAYARFREILKDEEILSSLFPKAKI